MPNLKIVAPAIAMVCALCAAPGTHAADEAVVTPLLAKELANIPGKEVLMLTVDYAPGAADRAHRHAAHAFIYVLEGSIVMQVNGGEEVTLIPGQTFYEAPTDIHTVGRNASATESAKFLVLLLKDKGVPPVLPPPNPSR
jgi:quercetin dioxygenase-like cupin family protein